MTDGLNPFTFACPVCQARLSQMTPDELCCPQDGRTYARRDGIWRFLAPEVEAYYQRFIREYETIRQAEGRGIPQAAYYRALPDRDLSGHFSVDWRVRAASYSAFVAQVLRPHANGDRLKILDLGAGNGWLSNRLAGFGHFLAAVDLTTSELDGLGAYVHYTNRFLPVQADFNHLPFTDGDIDLVIFNASFHYSTGYEATLGEALRVLQPGGQVVILDSPVYRTAASGEAMVREREALFQRRYGFPSNAIPSENFLTYQRLDVLAETLGLRWEAFAPHYELSWRIRRWLARLRSGRELARFMVIAGRRSEQGTSVLL